MTSGLCSASLRVVSRSDHLRLLYREFRVVMSLRKLITHITVHVLGTGSECLAKTKLLDSIGSNCNPVFILLPVTADLLPATNSGSARSSHPYGGQLSIPSKISPSELSQASGDVDIHGLALLKHIVLEISETHFSKLVVPIAVVEPDRLLDASKGSHLTVPRGISPAHAIKCIETGALDIISSPLDPTRLRAMSTLAYRAHIEGRKAQPKFLELKKSRKLSWVGVDEEKPYAYLREVM